MFRLFVVLQAVQKST